MATDGLGVEVRAGGRVMVTAWGGRVRNADVRTTVTVGGFTPRGNITHDHADLATLPPSYVQVLRRDGESGFEGNAHD